MGVKCGGGWNCWGMKVGGGGIVGVVFGEGEGWIGVVVFLLVDVLVGEGLIGVVLVGVVVEVF